MTVIWALTAALCFGLADFLGGLLTRRASLWAVSFLMQISATVSVAAFWLADPLRPTLSALLWGAGAGLVNGVGTLYLYRGLAQGRMGVVAPVSGALAAVLPVVVGLLIGERPALLAWVGVLIAVPGIWLVARAPAAAGRLVGTGSGFGEGAAAGACFGLLFVLMSRIQPTDGLLPVALSEAVAGAMVALVAIAWGQRWLPTERAAWPAAGVGVLVGIAMTAFLLASHTGYLAVSSVLTSLYPGVTVVLASFLLRERISRPQGVGLVLCGIAVAMVAAG